MAATLISPDIHRFIVKVTISEVDKYFEQMARSSIFITEKRSAAWTVNFIVSPTQSKISFSTTPACILQETHRIVCSILNNSELGVITFGGREASLHKDLAFFKWDDVLEVCKSKGLMQICIDIIDSPSDGMTAFRPVTNLQMLSFLENGEHSDVTIKTELKEFKAHKIVLAARSSVFAAMFRNDMKEKNTGEVVIRDVRIDVFEEMLHYMYSNDCEKLPEMVCELFALADKYDVQDLQSLCADYLLNNISVKNVSKVLKLCDTYVLHNIKERALKFVVDNEALVIKHEEYLVYLEENVKVENVAENLMLAQKYKIVNFKQFLMEFIAKNYSSVIKDHKYRQLYLSGNSVRLILEIDEYYSAYIVKLLDRCGIR